jgi:hypothetical protein
MAKIRDIQRTGSIGPIVTQGGRFGQIQRQRVTPINPKTTRQQTQRGILASVVSEWRGLTDAVRDAWEALAAQISGNLTGAMCYAKINATRVTCGQAKLETPPLPPAFGILSATGLTVNDTPLIKLVSLADTVAPDKFMIFATPPVSQGINNLNASFRLLSVVAGHDTAADVDLTDAYVAKFGAPQITQRLAVRISPVKDGFKGIPFEFTGICVAH